MLRHSEPQRPPTMIGFPAIGGRLESRYVLPKVAVLLLLILSAVGVWLSLEGIGAATLDLALGKWVQLLTLAVLLIGSAWGAFLAGRRHDGPPFEAAMPFFRFQFTRLVLVQEYATALLVGSGIYVLVGYALRFAERYGPWYNGLIGLQGLVLLVLANVVYMSNIEPQAKGRGYFRLMVALSLLSFMLVAALDLVPYLG